jgi:hypothetical protein
MILKANPEGFTFHHYLIQYSGWEGVTYLTLTTAPSWEL